MSIVVSPVPPDDESGLIPIQVPSGRTTPIPGYVGGVDFVEKCRLQQRRRRAWRVDHHLEVARSVKKYDAEADKTRLIE